MTTSQDFVALDWIKGEVGQTLEKAQQSLMAASESSDKDQTDNMKDCLASIHQVHSTLRMVELSGPIQIAEQMEMLAQALADNSVSQVTQAQETLMQAILQMPRYLERVLREQKELPQASGSIVNNLRGAQGEGSVASASTSASEYMLAPFSQQLSSGAKENFSKRKGPENLPKLRQKYQQALVALLKKNKPRENLTLMGKVFSTTGKLCGDSPMGHLMNISVALIEGIVAGAIKLDNALGNTLKQLDKPLKLLSKGATEALGNPVSEDLVREILDRTSSASKITPRMQAVLDKYVVTASVSLEQVDDFALLGPDDDTIGTVIKILMDELKGVTDKLDLYVRAETRNKQDLLEMVPLMGRISGTLSMVGMQEYQDQVDQQIVALKEMQSSADEPSEEQLLEMARAFIELETRLGGVAGGGEEGEDTDKLGGLDVAQATVAKETRIGLSQCTDAVLEFVASEWDKEKIKGLTGLLLSLRGGLIIIEQPRAGDIVLACARYIEKVLIEEQKVPTEEEVDYLADALTSIDYFLERLLENSSEPYIQMIEVAEESVEKLGFEVSEVLEREADKEVQAKVSKYDGQDHGAARQEMEGNGDKAGEVAEILEDQEEGSSAEGESFDLDSLDQGDDGMIDDEIIEIFIEESGEVLETIAEFLPKLKENASDNSSLVEIRRAFHTLKGSGRMVGAIVIGELSWAIEDMLNRVISKTIESSEGILLLLEETVNRVPEGVKAFQDQNQESVNYEDLVARAEAYSSGVGSAIDELDDSSEDATLEEVFLTEDTITEEIVDDIEAIETEEIESLEIELPPSMDVAEIEEQERTEEFFLEEVPLQKDELTLPEGLEEVLGELEDEVDVPDFLDDETTDLETIPDDDEIMKALEALASEGQPQNAADENLDDDIESLSLVEIFDEEREEDQPEDFLSQDALPEEHSSLMDDALELIDLEGDDSNIDDSLSELEAEVGNLTSDLEIKIEPDILDDESFFKDIESSTTPPEIDEELADIFKAEANEHLEILNSFVQRKAGKVTPELIASFHTLRGSSGMAGISSVASIAVQLEKIGIQYHTAGTAADPGFYELVQSGASYIEQIVSDLAQFQETVPGFAGFTQQAEALYNPTLGLEPPSIFEFDEIRLLPEASSILEHWDLNFIRDVIEELRDVNKQAVKSDRAELVQLSGSMLNVYQNQIGQPGQPGQEVMDLLKLAHESLTKMLDHVAASQDLTLPLDIVNSLDAIKFEQQDEQDFKELTKEAWKILIGLGAAIQKLRVDSTNIMPVEQVGQYFSDLEDKFYSLGMSELSTITMPLKQICEELVSGVADISSSDIKLMELARNEVSDQLNRISGNKDIFLDEEIVSLINQRVGKEKPEADDLDFSIETLEAEDASSGVFDDLDFDSLDVESMEDEPPLSRDKSSGDKSSGDKSLAAPSGLVDEIDDEILAMFLEEAEEILEDFDQVIVDWSSSPASSENMDALLRHLHTLKGGARMAGLNTLGEFVHNFESDLINIQQNSAPYNEEFFSLLNQHLDEINRRLDIFKKMASGEATDEEVANLSEGLSSGVRGDDESLEELDTMEDTSFGDLLEELDFEEASLDDEPETKISEPPSFDISEIEEIEDEITEVVSENIEAPAVPNEITLAEQLPETAVNEPAESSSSTPQSQDVIRVGQEILESLISLAGESSITRGRVEQQITDFAGSLEEMEATIGRMRNQVRKLEIEAESRETLIQTSLNKDGGGSFDDLEMDRYTFLQEISRSLSESASDMMDLKDTLANKSRDAETLLHQQARIAGELQEGLTRTRMVPFARLIPRLRRIVRQVSAEVGKSVRFETFNVEGELDRTVLDRIVAPLEHMLRNAVDHGIEDKETRKSVDKPETGRISLRLSREGGYVVVHISDDGAGIDVEAVRKKAIERGLIPQGAKVTDYEVHQFIIHAGFTTAEKLTQISGRGVGMDVVDTEIKQLGGTLTINSRTGVGSEFIVRLPFTVSINRALMVVVKEETYAVPLNTIEGIVRVSPYELEAYYAPDAPMFEYAGQPYRLFYLGKLLAKSDGPNFDGSMSALPVILARSGDQAVALQVDKVIGSREIVSKSLGPQFSDLSGVSGATVLGDGSVVIILDVMSFVRMADLRPVIEEPQEPIAEAQEPESHIRTVMVVDDSVTVRKVTSRLLERQGWEVVTAKDGVDAINQLQDIYPDVMLLDIEMPKMDGFEVLSTVRRDERLKELPIIMITSRTGEKHKQQALELGVNQYLGKPFQEASLMSTIEEVLKGSNRTKA